MTNRTQPSMTDLAANYDAASLAFDRAMTVVAMGGSADWSIVETARAAKNAAHAALLMAERAAEVAS